MNNDVFISYSRKDIRAAEEIVDALSKAGISCFFDMNLDNPDVWDILVREIENCKVFLYLGSKNTAEARITPKELTYAVNHKDRSCIYPYFIDDFALPKIHEFLLADINWRKKSNYPIDSCLIPDLLKILNREVVPCPPKQLLKDDILRITVGGRTFEMIRIEGGRLAIGATEEQVYEAESNEYPPHIVDMPTFYIGRYLVTQNIWEIVMGYNKSHYAKEESRFVKMVLSIQDDSNRDAIKEMLDLPVKDAVVKVGGFAIDKLKQKVKEHLSNKSDDKGHYPVENISHDEALEFVRRLSQVTNIQFALPTEEEWEYAARGGQESKGNIYAGSNNIEDVAWYRDNAGRTTHPVGQKLPNELGLYDMCGNVWEWTETPAHSYDSTAEPGGSVFIRRGGSSWQESKNCRVSRRYASDHTKKTSGLGLRVVIRENVE